MAAVVVPVWCGGEVGAVEAGVADVEVGTEVAAAGDFGVGAEGGMVVVGGVCCACDGVGVDCGVLVCVVEVLVCAAAGAACLSSVAAGAKFNGGGAAA